jgi:uncharacterized membrane protein
MPLVRHHEENAMNRQSTGPDSSTSSRSLQALMYAATVGIAIVGAVSMSLAAQAQDPHASVPRRGDVSMRGGPADCSATPSSSSDPQEQRT